MSALWARWAVILLMASSLDLRADLVHARLVEALSAQSEESIRVVLGSIENLSTGLVAERERIIEGKREVALYEAPPTLSHQSVFDELRESRLASFSTQFVCEGRDCGSSADWANGIFGFRLLYGPEQYQHYWVGLDTIRDVWQVIYVGRRGNGKVYYLTMSIRSRMAVFGSDFIDYAGLKLWRLPLSAFEGAKGKVAERLRARLGAEEKVTLVVAVSGPSRGADDESFGLNQSLRRAEAIAADLRPSLPRSVTLVPQGLGILSPVPELPEARVDIFWFD
jgi:hypothetical protein